MSTFGRTGKGAVANYRMRDLCQATGLERQTIHFYIQEGLLPEGKKTGRNMAYYGEDHLERLRLIKKLQEERFLPLRAIRAVLGGKSGGFSKEQRKLLADVKTRLLDAAPGRELVGGPTELVSVSDVAEAHGVKARDVEEMIELGLLTSEGASNKIRRDDAWLVGAWADLNKAGLSRERGFTPKDLMMVDEAITGLFEKERELFIDRLIDLAPEDLARLLERVLPIMGDLISKLHAQKTRDIFALAIEEPSLKGART
jgi:DNA-binding transcriptional MerR regulator